MFKRAIKEELKVPADINYLGEMRDFVTRIGRKYGVSEKVINAFKLAIDEAATNVIRHAYRDWDGFITMRVFIRERDMTVSMVDQGHNFDLRNVKDPDLQRYVDIGKKGGLGIFIIRRVIDNIDYRKTVEGNELRLTKARRVVPKLRIGVPGVTFTMKLRVSFIASLVLTVLIGGVSSWFYFRQKSIIREDQFNFGYSLAQAIGENSKEFLQTEDALELSRIVSAVQRDNASAISEALVVDREGTILGSNATEVVLETFIRPRRAVRISDNIYEYELNRTGSIYEIVQHVNFDVDGETTRLGNVHILMKKSAILQKIGAAQRRILSTAFLVWLAGCIGIIIIVNMTMSPLRKLSKWVQALGHGDNYEEMEFDASDEVGEIAHAFNEITDKFRKSQVNLAEQERLQKEMQVAQEIQHTLLPAQFPEIEGYEIASYYEAAKEVGGDYFDFVEVDKDTLGIVVADVSGKGVPGSLIMTMIRTALRTEARGNKDAADVLAKVNDFVLNDMKRGMFVTIFYIILDSKTRTISYASAGHNPMILYRSSTQKSYYLNPRGFPIGISLPDKALFRKSIQSDSLRLREGDVLFSYTDGITEAMNSRRERFGDERFLASIRKYGILAVEPLVEKLKEDIIGYTEGYAQSDDITMVAIREKMNVEDVLFNLRSRLMRMVIEEGVSIKDACKKAGVSTSTYYKYRKLYDKHGDDGLREKVSRSEIEERHISIEDKAKIIDIIRQHPEYGPKRISEVLKSEEYDFTEVEEKRLYEELKKSRLNTKALREAFIERGQKGKRLKAPGTPFLTLDGQVIMDVKETVKPVMPPKDEIIESKSDMREDVPETPDAVETEEDVEEIELQSDDIAEFDETIEETIVFEDNQTEFESSDDEVNVSETVEEDEDDMDFSEFLEMTGDDFDEEASPISEDINLESDIQDAPAVEDELISDKVEISTEAVDEVFDEFIMGMDEFEDFQDDELVEEVEVEIPLEKILEEESPQEPPQSDIDNHITASSADEFFELEMSEDEDLMEDHHAAIEELTEDFGYDQQQMFDESTLANDAILEANRKQFLEAGLWFYKQGLYGKAIEEFGKAIEEDPDLTEGYQFLGDSFFRMGQLDKAREAYEKVKRLDPDNMDVQENLGVIFANTGDYKKAVLQWGEVLKHNPHRVDIINRIKRMQRVIRLRSV